MLQGAYKLYHTNKCFDTHIQYGSTVYLFNIRYIVLELSIGLMTLTYFKVLLHVSRSMYLRLTHYTHAFVSNAQLYILKYIILQNL